MTSSAPQIDKIGLGPTIVAGRQMPWAKGVIAGDFIFLSGTAGAVDDDGRKLPSIEEQTVRAFERSARALEEAGSSLDRAVRINQYLSDRSLRERYVKARTAWLSEHAPKLLEEQAYASILVEQQLMSEDMLIEIEVTALR